MNTRAFTIPVAAITLFAALAGCGSSSSSSSHSSTGTSSKAAAATVTQAKHVSIAIADFVFKPAKITVRSGTKLTFTNSDSTAHTATTKAPGFDTGTVKPGRSATVTVSAPGTYHYVCQFHPFMVGKVVVVG